MLEGSPHLEAPMGMRVINTDTERQRVFQERARECGLRTLRKDDWLRVDNAVITKEYRIEEGGEQKVQEEEINPELSTSEEVGTFDSNSGVIACVDEYGVKWIAKNSPARRRELEEAGYVGRGLTVPLSNGEKFKNTEMQSRWERLKASAY